MDELLRVGQNFSQEQPSSAHPLGGGIFDILGSKQHDREHFMPQGLSGGGGAGRGGGGPPPGMMGGGPPGMMPGGDGGGAGGGLSHLSKAELEQLLPGVTSEFTLDQIAQWGPEELEAYIKKVEKRASQNPVGFDRSLLNQVDAEGGAYVEPLRGGRCKSWILARSSPGREDRLIDVVYREGRDERGYMQLNENREGGDW